MADNTVRDNSPDPTRYHQNIGGMPGTMIPRAGREGQSLAFDPNKPQTVIVDPGEIGGGFTLDMASLLKSKTKFNSAAVRQEVANDPTAFYRELSQENTELTRIKDELTTKLQEKMKEPIVMPDQIEPLASLPPLNPAPKHHSLPDETAMESRAAAFDTEGAIQRLLHEEKLKATMLRDRQRDWSAMVHDDSESVNASSEMREMRAHLSKQGEAINALIGVVTRMTEKVAEPTVKESPKSNSPAVEDEVIEKDLLTGLNSLQIAFLAEGKPQRPQFETYFEMSKMGTMAARYHAVVAGQDCVALVYDTRFQDGFQYLPPNLGEERITVSVPKLEKGVYTCSSLGLHWSLGCLDVVILIKHGDTQ